MAHISTHVLDVAKGRPVAGVQLELSLGLTMLKIAWTNADGRTDEPLIVNDTLKAGGYDLTFRVGDYLRAQGQNIPFYEVITVHFVIGDGARNYHVPLLLAPHSYSTYLGS